MSCYRDWHVGMKVVCVDAPWPPYVALVVGLGAVLPTVGKVYTIRQIGIPNGDDRVCVRLVEIINPPIAFPGYPPGEPKFGAIHFRPIQQRKTDIGVFIAMLTGTKKKVPA